MRPVVGSPAHAGIDPEAGGGWSWRGWLPRSRGDRPCVRIGWRDALEAPPLTRGSTLADVAALVDGVSDGLILL
jgi:hypothetical protein